MATGMSVNFLLNQLRSYQGSLAGGTVEFWNAQTNTLATVYLDRLLTQVAANPYVLSADGNAELFADIAYTYNVVIRNASGVIVYDWNDIQIAIPSTGGGGGTPPVTGSITYTLKTVTNSNVPHALDLTAVEQYVSRSGVGTTAGLTVDITCPGGTFAGGMTTRKLYADGETMHFVRYGTVFYVVA